MCNYSNHTFVLISWSCWGGLVPQWKTALFHLCREREKRGRERTNQTQNQKVRGLFLHDSFYLFLFFFLFFLHLPEYERKLLKLTVGGLFFLQSLSATWDTTLLFCYLFILFDLPLFIYFFFHGLTHTNFYPCFCTLTSSLWGSVLIAAGMSAVVQPNDHKIKRAFTCRCTF